MLTVGSGLLFSPALRWVASTQKPKAILESLQLMLPFVSAILKVAGLFARSTVLKLAVTLIHFNMTFSSQVILLSDVIL